MPKRPSASPTSQYLNLVRAESEYGVNYFTLRRLVERGLLKRVDSDLVGRSLIVKRSDLEALLERGVR
jgi:hypothetical protein